MSEQNRSEVALRFLALNGEHPMTKADDAYVDEYFVPLARLCAQHGREIDAVRVDMLAGRLPLPGYLRSDGTEMVPPDLFDLADRAGGLDDLPAWFQSHWEDEKQGASEWADYLSGQYVCLREQAPHAIQRKDAVLALLTDELAAPQPDQQAWRNHVADLVDELDALELPFTAYDRLRFGGPVTRDVYIDDVRAKFGLPVPERFRWLEDADNPRTTAWVADQDSRFTTAAAAWPSRAGILADLVALTAFDHLTSPIIGGDVPYLTWRTPDGEFPRLVAVTGEQVQVVFEPTDGARLGYFAPSTDGRLVAYQVAVDGSEEFTLRIKDLASDADLPESLPGCRYASVSWLPGTDTFYYTHPARTAPEAPRVYRHRVGTEFADDPEIFGADLVDADDLDIAVAPDGSTVVVSATSGLSVNNQLWIGSATDNPEFTRLTVADNGWTGVWPGRRGRLYLLTDDKAPRNQLLVLDAPAADPSGVVAEDRRAMPGAPTVEPRCLVPEDERATLESFAVLDENGAAPEILALWSSEGTSRVTRHDLASGRVLGQVPLPGNGVITEFTFGDGSADQVWFTYSDRVTPETVYTYRRGADRSVAWLTPTQVDAPDVEISTEDYLSADGTPVRLLLVRPADAPDGPLPTILEGYGAFGVAQVPEYYAAALAWARQGGLFAVAGVRGGGEYGEDWHRAGMRRNKQRGIDDFITAARHLIDTGRTEPARLGAFGQSAGGLLVAAAMTQRPDLFGAVACTAAPLDMARYELSGFGAYWVEEFGSRDDPEDLAVLLGYSPFHQVREVGYPAVLLSTFEQDSRVDPLHARKMCAALQAVGASALLRRDAAAGHGERDRTGRLAYFADVLAFLQHELRPGAKLTKPAI
ncbi:MAG TPA: DUF6058 family natural product biosynthesis protein [Pseudonocardiaceae bacterium]|jgi:prolyl oligopeptidase